jgi:lipopolysaccharide exporter
MTFENIGFRNWRTHILGLATRDLSVVVSTMFILNVLRLASSLILTRLLAPADFGIAGMVTVAHYTIMMLLDLGTDAFLIRHQEVLTRHQLDVIWTIRFVRLVIVAMLTALAAGIISRILGNPSLTIVLAVSALGILASAPLSLSAALAVRNKQLILTSSIDVGMAIFNLFLTIGLALWIKNYWALIISSILGTAAHSALSYLIFPSPVYRLAFDPKLASELWKFSRYVAGSSVITLVLSQVDKFILGHFLTLGQFGIYMLAANVAFIPRMFCGTYGSRVLFPTYAQAYRTDPSSMTWIFHAKLKFLGPLYCFAVGGLIGFAPVVIFVMYPHQYGDAAFYLAFLSIPPFFALSTTAATEALIVVGDVQATYHANLVRVAWLIPMLSAAAGLGNTNAVLLVLALSELPATVYTWWKLRKKGILSLRLELPAFLAGGLGLIVGWLLYKFAELFISNIPEGLVP